MLSPCSCKCMQLLRVQRYACFRIFCPGWRSRRDWCAIACCAALPPIMMGMEFADDNDGVTVPRGMGKLKSLHTLRYVHLAWGNAAVEEIKGLTNLCLAISKLSLLESLSLTSLSLNSPLDLSVLMSDMKPPPENLQSLKLFGGPMAKVPEWIKGLQNLVKLRLVSTGLCRDGAAMLMQDIGKLPNLSILSLKEYYGGGDITVGDVQFKSGLFMSLKVLDLVYPPGFQFKSVKFDDKAMPKLEVLRLTIGKAVSLFGVEHLKSIKEIRVRYIYSPSDTKESVSRELREQLDKVKMGHVLKVD